MKKKIGIKNTKATPETAENQNDNRENKKRFTIDMPVPLHTRLKVAAAKRGETMTEITCAILEENLKDD